MFVSLTRIKKVINNPISGWMFLWQYIKARLLKYKKIKNILPSDKHKFLIEDEAFLKLLEKNIADDIKIFDNVDLQNINWNYDYINKVSIPFKYYFNLREWIVKNSFKGFDIKNVWELSRGYYLKDMAIKFYQTNNQDYLKTYKRIIDSWIDQNTYLYSSNWTNPMEVSIRSLNWILSFRLITKKDPDAFDEAFRKRFYLNLNQSFVFLINNIETYPFKSNHYTTDNLGIFVLSLIFDNTHFIKKSFNNLVRSLKEQFDNNGVDFENSSNYQLLKIEAIMIAILLRKKNPNLADVLKFSEEQDSQLKNIYVFSKYLFKNDEDIFNFGDNDETKIFDIQPLKQKLEYLYRSIIPQDVDTMPSKTFGNSGYNFLKNEDFNVLFLRNNQKNGSHFHNDLLSFQLNYKGEDFFVDPNTFSYNLNAEKRAYYISTRHHNTCTINHQEQSKINKLDPFFRSKQKRVTVKKQSLLKSRDEVVLKIDYSRYSHSRSLIFNKDANKINIFDTFNGNIKNIEWNFYLPKDVTIKNDLKIKNILLLENNSKTLILEIPEMLALTINKTYISTKYNQEEEGTNIRLQFENTNHLQNLSFQINIMEKYLK